MSKAEWKKVISNFIIVMLEVIGLYIILKLFSLPDFFIGWSCASLYCFDFFRRKGSGLRLIPEDKLKEIDNRETEEIPDIKNDF